MEKLGTLICENHGLPAEMKHTLHEFGLHRYYDYKHCETSQGTRTQVDQEDDQTDDQLDWSGPAHVEKTASVVDTRNVCGDVVDQFSIGVDMSCAGGERESFVVDRGDQSRTQQHTGTGGTVEEVVHRKRRQNLKEEETECETDAVPNWRGRLPSMACGVGTLGETNQSLTQK